MSEVTREEFDRLEKVVAEIRKDMDKHHKDVQDQTKAFGALEEIVGDFIKSVRKLMKRDKKWRLATALLAEDDDE